MHVPSDELNIACCDENNVFSRVEVPAWMAPWFAAPPLRAVHVWRLLPADVRRDAGPAGWVCAFYHRLPMGSSHSVHILMSLNMEAMGRVLWASARFAECGPPLGADDPRSGRQLRLARPDRDPGRAREPERPVEFGAACPALSSHLHPTVPPHPSLGEATCITGVGAEGLRR